MLLTERYSDKISGVISCFDRVVVQGTLPDWCYNMGMTVFLHMHQIKIFDYPAFANNLRLELRDHAELIAKENDLEIEFIRKTSGFRKEARIKEILASRGMQLGLVHIFSAMEALVVVKEVVALSSISKPLFLSPESNDLYCF